MKSKHMSGGTAAVCFAGRRAGRPSLLVRGDALLASIVESSDDAIIAKDLNGIIRSWNRGAERIFGYTAEEAIGRPVAMLAVPERADEFPNILQKIARGQSVEHYETVRRAKDGRTVEVSLTVSPLRNDMGEIVGASKIARDVTERRKMERASRESEERLSALIFATEAIIFTTAANGQIIAPQASWEAYTGQHWPEYAGWGGLQAMHPDDVQKVEAAWLLAVETGELLHVESRLWHAASCEFRYTMCRVVPIRNSDGSIREWVGAFDDIHDRRVAEVRLRHSNQALRESEDHYRHTVELNPQVPWTCSAEGQLEDFSPQWLTLTGLTREEALTRGWAEVPHPDDHTWMLRVWEESVRTGAPFEVEHRIRVADGSYRWMRTRARPRRDAEGRIVRWYGNTEDIEQRKQAEAALRVSEERFRSIVEAAAEGIWIIDTAGKTTFVNPRMGELLGYEPQQMVDRSCFDFIHPEEQEWGLEGFRKRKENRDFGPREYRFVRRDGTIRWLSFLGSPMYDAAGTMTGVLAMCTDSTERRLAEEHIRHLNHELTAKVTEFEVLLSVAPVGIAFSYDVMCRTVKLNPAAQRIFSVEDGLEPSKTGPDADRLPYQVMRNGVEVPGEELPLQVAARTGEIVPDAEYDIVRKDGPVIPVICSASPLCDDHGKPRGSVAAILDISERKHAENALRRANTALEQFAYAAAHDLQEPVRNVTLYTQYLARQYRGKLDPQADEFIKLTVDGARRLQNLIQDLLSYTKAIDEPDEAGAGSDAEVAMEEVLQNLRTAVELANAEVFYRDLPRVGVRHCQVVQLLQNFVTNALKYRSREAPQIHISAERQGAAWLFTVRDNGMGIAPEHHERIFRVFKRLHGREIPGTGIGLAVCERIVTHYGGRIWVESEAGHGATFYFTLPSAAGRE